MEKIPDPRNTKEHYQSFRRKKNKKAVKKSEIITYQPKSFENPNIVDIKWVITEDPKTSHKLSKTKKKGEKVGCNSSLYSDTNKSKHFLNERNVKITKREHAFKGYASTCNVEVLNSFNPKLQLKGTGYVTKRKLIQLLAELEGFKFVITLVLVFKNIESEDKTNHDHSYSSSKAETIINESNIDMCFNQSIVRL